MVYYSDLESSGVASDSQAEENDLHNWECEDEQHHAYITPHSQEVLLQKCADLATRCKLERKNEFSMFVVLFQRSLSLRCIYLLRSHHNQ